MFRSYGTKFSTVNIFQKLPELQSDPDGVKWENCGLGFYKEFPICSFQIFLSKFYLKIWPVSDSKIISHCQAWEIGWIIIFPFRPHWWLIDGFRMSHFNIDSPNEIIFEFKKKVEWSKNENLNRDEFLETEKKRTEWKKEVIDTFWLFSQSTE